VGHEQVTVGEGDEIGELLCPEQGVDYIRLHDSVDARVPFAEEVVPERGTDVPARPVDDDPVAHFDEPHRTRARRRVVGGFEVDRGEVQGHVPILARASDGGLIERGGSRSVGA